MKPETFFKKFELFADAPGAVAKMRELVLNLAVQGRLVPNDLDHPLTAEQIRKQKQQKLHELKIRSHPDTPVIADSDFPFCLPRAWIAVTLGDLAFSCLTSYGGDPIPSLPRAGVVKVGNIDNQGGFKGKFTDRGFPKDEIDGLLARRGDLMVVKSSGSAENVHSGKTALCTAEHDGKIVGSNFVLRLRLLGSSAEPEYVWRVLTSRYSRSWVEGTVQTMTYPNLKWSDFARLPIPLPPPAEQKRIVAKVDELMALCDRLEAQQQERETRHAALARAALARFAEAPTPANLEFLFHNAYAIPLADLRKSILTLAVQGKLVTQDRNDACVVRWMKSIAQQPSKHQMACTEPPFDLPPSWAWLRVDAAFEVAGGIQKTPQRAPRHNAFPYLGVSNVQRGRLDLADVKKFELDPGELERRRLKMGDLLVIEGNGSFNEIGRCAKWSGEIDNCVHQNHVIRCRPVDAAISDFVLLFLNSPYGVETMQRLAITSSGLYSLSVGKIRQIEIPLPPLAEQRRIVAKVDGLMALVDKLEAELASARETATNLLAAAVAELTQGKPSHVAVQS